MQLSRTILAAGLLPLLVLAWPSEGAGQVAVRAEYRSDGSFRLPSQGRPGGVERPQAVAVDAEGHLHVVDREGAVHVYDASGGHLRSYTRFLKDPRAVDVDSAGHGFVLDGDRKQVLVFTREGEVIRFIGREGSGPGRLDDPTDMALGPAGHVYVLDRDGPQLEVFAPDGTFLRGLPLRGTVEDPRALTVGRDGTVYVSTASEYSHVWALPPYPRWPGFGPPGGEEVRVIQFRGGRLEEAASVTVNHRGTVVVADPESGRLWSRNPGAEQGDEGAGDDVLYGGKGSGRGAFQEIADLEAIDPDEVVILDAETRKIERIRMAGEAQRPLRPLFRPTVRVHKVPGDLSGRLLALHRSAEAAAPDFFVLGVAGSPRVQVYRGQEKRYATVYDDSARYYALPTGSPDGSVLQQGADEIGGLAANDTLMVATHPGRDRFAIYDRRDGSLVGTFGSGYQDDRRLDEPRGVGLTSDGRIVVADKGNDRVAIFSPDLASLLATYVLEDAWGVAVGPGDRIYAWKEDGSRVIRLPASREEGVESLQRGVDFRPVAGLAVGPGGNLVMLDRETGRVSVRRPSDHAVLAQMGSREQVREPERVLVDEAGNIYAVDRASGQTLLYGWSVTLSAPEAVTVAFSSRAVRLSWEPAPENLLRTYRLEGADRVDGDYRSMGRTAGPPVEIAVTDTAGPPPRYLRLVPVSVTGRDGAPSDPVPLFNLTARAAFEAGRHADALEDARRTIRALEDGAVSAEGEVRQEMLWLAFESARSLDQTDEALEWAGRLEEAGAGAHRVELAARKARLQARTGREEAARQTLLDLVAAGLAPAAYTDSTLLRACFDVARAAGDTASYEPGVRFLQRWADALPAADELEGTRAAFQDSASVYETRGRLAPGLRYWQNAEYSQAIRFFRTQLGTGSLSLRSELLARQVLAAVYYAFGRTGEADEQFRQIYSIRPGFDIEARAAGVEALYGVSLYNSEMKERFARLRPGGGGP